MSAGGHLIRNRTELRNNVDLNTLRVPGIYALHNPTNGPSSGDFLVDVLQARTLDDSTIWVAQVLTKLSDNSKKTRLYNGTIWGSYADLGSGGGSNYNPASVVITGGTITGLPSPSGASDAANKAYVDALVAGIGGTRVAVRAATTANIVIATALNNGDVLDGVTLATNDLVLVKDQTAPAENGVYVVGVVPARSTSFNTMAKLAGMLAVVQVGTANIGTLWFCTSAAAGTIDVDPVVITGVHITGTNLVSTPGASNVVISSSTGGAATVAGATQSLAGALSALDKTKLDGIEAGAEVNVPTNLSQSRDASSVTVVSDTGADAVLLAADATHAGVMLAADKAKLDSITAGAGDLSIDLSIGTNDATTLEVVPSRGAKVALPLAAPSPSKAGIMSGADKGKLNGIAAGAQVNVPTNLGLGVHDATSLKLTSSTGGDATLPAADHDLAGLMSATDKVKLDNLSGGGGGPLPTDLSIGTVTPTTVQVQSSTGASATIPGATPSAAGVLSAADKAIINALGTAADLASDTDTALTANSDTRLPTQKAVRAFVAAQLAGSAGLRLQVRAATTANITIASALNNGSVLDGITLATNDLVLVKNQTLPAQNGVYVVGVSPARYSGLNTYAAFIGAVIAVAVGTVNAGTIWFSLASGSGTIDVTSITFAGLTVAGTDLGIGSQTATTLAITSSTGATATLPLATAVAGTNKAGLLAPAEKDAITALKTASTLDFDTDGTLAANSDAKIATQKAVKTAIAALRPVESIVIAVGDETTALTTGAAKITFRMPYAFTLTDVRASLTTASASGLPTINIKEGGTTIFSTKITIDATELTSTTALTPMVLSDTSLADDAQMTVDIDTAGSGAAGLKVVLIGRRT